MCSVQNARSAVDCGRHPAPGWLAQSLRVSQAGPAMQRQSAGSTNYPLDRSCQALLGMWLPLGPRRLFLDMMCTQEAGCSNCPFESRRSSDFVARPVTGVRAKKRPARPVRGDVHPLVALQNEDHVLCTAENASSPRTSSTRTLGDRPPGLCSTCLMGIVRHYRPSRARYQ